MNRRSGSKAIAAILSHSIAFALATHAVASPIQGTGEPISALPGGQVITFDSGPTGPFTSLTLSGVTFSGSGGKGGFLIDNEYIGNYNTRGTYSFNNNRGAGYSTITFNFNGGTTNGFAFLFGASDFNWTLTAYNSSGGVLETMNIAPTRSSNAGDYFGLNDPGIASASLVAPSVGDFIFIDDFTFLPNMPIVVPRHDVVYQAIDLRAIDSAIYSGLGTAVIASQVHQAASRAALRDINGHLFALRAGEQDEDANELADAEPAGAQGDNGFSKDSKSVQPPSPHAHNWKVFSSIDYGDFDLNSMGSQAGVSGDTWAPSVGVERRLWKHVTFGLALSYLHSDQNYSDHLGGLRLQGLALSTYLSYASGPFWSDLLYSYGNYDMDTTRNPGLGFSTAHGETGTHANALQFNTGWNFKCSFAGGKLTTGPILGLDYLDGRINGYSETGGDNAAVSISRQGYNSLINRLGWQISDSFKTPVGKITPQLRFAWERENLGNNGVTAQLLNSPYYLVRGTQVGNDPSTFKADSVTRENKRFSAGLDQQIPGRGYLTVGAGVQFDFGRGCTALVDYEGVFFRSDLTEHLVSARLGYSF